MAGAGKEPYASTLFCPKIRPALSQSAPLRSRNVDIAAHVAAGVGVLPPGAHMTRKRDIAACLPVRRGLSEHEAAVYLSFSPTFFRELVAAGIMPKPRVVRGRRVWDIEELDVAFKGLPREGREGLASAPTGWEDFDDTHSVEARRPVRGPDG